MNMGSTIKKIIDKNKEKEDEERAKHIREKYGKTPDLGKISYKEGIWINDATNIQ